MYSYRAAEVPASSHPPRIRDKESKQLSPLSLAILRSSWSSQAFSHPSAPQRGRENRRCGPAWGNPTPIPAGLPDSHSPSLAMPDSAIPSPGQALRPRPRPRGSAHIGRVPPESLWSGLQRSGDFPQGGAVEPQAMLMDPVAKVCTLPDQKLLILP